MQGTQPGPSAGAGWRLYAVRGAGGALAEWTWPAAVGVLAGCAWPAAGAEPSVAFFPARSAFGSTPLAVSIWSSAPEASNSRRTVSVGDGAEGKILTFFLFLGITAGEDIALMNTVPNTQTSCWQEHQRCKCGNDHTVNLANWQAAGLAAAEVARQGAGQAAQGTNGGRGRGDGRGLNYLSCLDANTLSQNGYDQNMINTGAFARWFWEASGQRLTAVAPCQVSGAGL